MAFAREASSVKLVYILGNSFSGSTVLSFLMAGSPDVLCLGELKMHNRIGDRICSCGTSARECPFWSYWDDKRYHLYYGDVWAKVKISIRLLLGLPVRYGPLARQSDDLLFLHEVRRENGYPRYLLDASKSVWRLIYLVEACGVEVTVVYTRRGLHGNVASFFKRFGRFWRPLLVCLSNDILCQRLLALHPQIPRIEVQHEELCEDPAKVLHEVGALLGVDYRNYREHLRTAAVHVRGGNQQTIGEQRRPASAQHAGGAGKVEGSVWSASGAPPRRAGTSPRPSVTPRTGGLSIGRGRRRRARAQAQ